MNCPCCNAEHKWKTVDSRHFDADSVYRVRECKACAIRVITKEVITVLHEPDNFGPWFRRRREYLKREGNISQKERT